MKRIKGILKFIVDWPAKAIGPVLFIMFVIMIGMVIMMGFMSHRQDQIAKAQGQIVNAQERRDCISQKQGQYFYDYADVFTLDTRNPETVKRFQDRLRQDAQTFINAGDICDEQLKKEKGK